MGRIYPSWQQIGQLRVQLTDGENALAKFLDDHLPDAWSIYVQPYVNDMRPDVVVCNPHVGMVVFEVKDWQLGRYRFEEGRMIAQTATDTWVEDDPVRKAMVYAKSLYEQFLISDEAQLEIGASPNNHALCRAAVYFHGASTRDARQLYAGFEYPKIIHGSDELVEAELESLVPYAGIRRSKYIRDAQVEALERAHSWLIPPRHAIEQQQPTRLTSGQAEYARPGSGFRRVRGVAGSGKSFVLTHRAARANQEGRNALLLSFTITMGHALRDLLKRAPYNVDWERVTYGHFHEWAMKQGIEAGFITSSTEFGRDDDQAPTPDEYDRGSLQSGVEGLAVILEKIINRQDVARSYTQPVYDGIYVDEGQDFAPSWLDALAGYLADDGELVLFADHKQNIYEQDGGRDTRRHMRRCRFSGPWAQLPQKSHRLPWRVALFLNDFAEATRLGDEEDLVIQDYAEREAQGELNLDVMAWHNVASVSEGLGCLVESFACLGEPNPGDVVVLVPNHSIGLEAVGRLSPRFKQIVHVFGDDWSESRRRKLAFWMGRGGLKMCTIHSFKGWELDNVILIWPPDEEMGSITPSKRASLFYTGVSRAMRNIVVLNANRGYDRFAKEWDPLTPSGE